jgi:hypothetical protein
MNLADFLKRYAQELAQAPDHFGLILPPPETPAEGLIDDHAQYVKEDMRPDFVKETLMGWKEIE